MFHSLLETTNVHASPKFVYTFVDRTDANVQHGKSYTGEYITKLRQVKNLSHLDIATRTFRKQVSYIFLLRFCLKVIFYLCQADRKEEELPREEYEGSIKLRSHPIHLVGKRTAQKDTIIDITSDSQVNSNFPYRWSPASLTNI